MRSTIRGSCILSCGLTHDDYGVPEVRYELTLPQIGTIVRPFTNPAAARSEIEAITGLAFSNVTDYLNLQMAMADIWPPTEEESLEMSEQMYRIETNY